MSFISAMKRAFGFSDEDDANDVLMEPDAPEIHYRDASVVPLKTLQANNNHQGDVQAKNTDAVTGADETATDKRDEHNEAVDPKLLAIFDGVLSIFNEAQPQFIRDCLDRDAQRRYLYAALESSVTAYVGNLAEETRKRALDSDKEERDRLHADVEAMREREKQTEQLLADQQTKQLSAQRQKRALTQRIEDSEKKIAELLAEREQAELQIRSLVNKLKVAEVRDGDAAVQRDEIEDLKNDISAKNAENSRLGMLIEQQKSEIDKLQQELSDARQKSAAAEMLQMTEEDRQMIQDVQEQMARFEEIKKSKDQKINSQKKQIAELSGQISAQESQLESLSARNSELEAQLSALQDMLRDMQSNSALDQSLQVRQNIIEQNTSETKTATESEPGIADETAPAKRSRAKRKPKVSAIDENLDSVNWLLTVPSDENPAPSVAPAAPDPDFGYQPPVKKEIAANDAQLTLF